MAKDGAKNGAKNGSGKKKGKLPKQIGGVKIPKELRHGAEKLLAQAQSPQGRAVIAKGVSAVAGVAAAAMQRSAQASAAKRAPTEPVVAKDDAGNDPKKETAQPDPLADAIGAAADAVLGRLFAKR